MHCGKDYMKGVGRHGDKTTGDDTREGPGSICVQQPKATGINHSQMASSRGMSDFRLMRNASDRIDRNNFKLLFTTYVRPHLEYCIQAVGPYTVQDTQTLERVQS